MNWISNSKPFCGNALQRITTTKKILINLKHVVIKNREDRRNTLLDLGVRTAGNKEHFIKRY